MRETRLYGSEGGEAKASPTPIMGKLPQAKFKWWVRPIRYAYIKRPLGTGIRIPSSFTVFNQNATDFSAFSSASFFDLPYRFSLY